MVRHHAACRVMSNSYIYPEWRNFQLSRMMPNSYPSPRNFQFAPNNHYGFFFLPTFPSTIAFQLKYALFYQFNVKTSTSEPRHDKTNKMSVRPAKTQISLGIRPVWSESSLSAWRKLGSLATHWADSEDSDQTGQLPRLIWVFARGTVILLVLSCRGSFVAEKCSFRFLSNDVTTKRLTEPPSPPPPPPHAGQDRSGQGNSCGMEESRADRGISRLNWKACVLKTCKMLNLSQMRLCLSSIYYHHY